ncbi:hypothetical protein [Microbacterium tenebrionis]|nr:hypothetical protein [Microbacterium ihumii]
MQTSHEPFDGEFGFGTWLAEAFAGSGAPTLAPRVELPEPLSFADDA